MLPLAACELLCEGLPAAASMADALRLLHRACELMLGEALLTVNLDVTTAQDPVGEIRLRRVWTSNAAAYPVGGGKTKQLTSWTRRLFEERKVFIGEGDDALAQVFDDHGKIVSLGLHSVVNVPVVQRERAVATFNVLGQAPRWTPEHVAAIRLLALLAAPFILAEVMSDGIGLPPA
jgi:GAF domain-containing protein